MTLSVTLLLGLAGLLMFLLVLVAVRRSTRSPSVGAAVLYSARPSPDTEERQASAASEAIEKLANEALARAGLPTRRVDFATAHDGSLEIWVGDVRYTSVESIPDSVIRKAVADAVSAFNQ